MLNKFNIVHRHLWITAKRTISNSNEVPQADPFNQELIQKKGDGDGAVKDETNRMKAWSIHSYGNIQELQLTKSRFPIIKNSTEVLVKVRAASLNPIDYMMIKGYAQTFGRFLRNYQLEFPLTLGRDFSGIVLDKGQDVDNLQVGDEVYGVLPIHHQGSHAELVIAEKTLTCKKPPNMNYIEAASIMYSGLTAWSALYLSGELCMRDPTKYRVLVTGASGGVGTLAIQMLVASGSTVIGTCSSQTVSFVQSLGAQAAHDYRDSNFVQNVAKDGPYDIILDCANLGHEKISPTWQYTKFITLNSPLVNNTDKYGILGGFAASAGDLFVANIPKCASGKSVRWGFFGPFRTGIEFIDDLIRAEKLHAVIHAVYPFTEVPYAFEHLSAGNLLGKIVIDVSNEYVHETK